MAVPDGAVVEIPRNPDEVVNMEPVLSVRTLALVVAKTFVAVRAFEANRLPWTAKLAPPVTGVVQIPTLVRVVTETPLVVLAALLRVVITLEPVRVFDTYMFPLIVIKAPGNRVVVPIANAFMKASTLADALTLMRLDVTPVV
jgi:hypothetical protein